MQAVTFSASTIYNVFGWKNTVTGYRINTVYDKRAKGKTAEMAGLALCNEFDCENRAGRNY
jgi:hypothetical protein